MVRGFKDRTGKFHPITTYKGVRKSRDKTKGVRIRKEKISQQEHMRLLQVKRETPNEENEIGLRRFSDRGSFQLNLVDEPKRIIGNKVIGDIVAMSKQNHPDLKDYKIHSNHVFNEYNEIQHALYYARNNVRELIKWRNEKSPSFTGRVTWKWLSPICLDDGTEDSKISCFDDQNLGWVSDGYKGKMALTIMSPRQFLELASPKTLVHGRKDIRGEKHTKEIVDKLTQRMMDGRPVDTMYLQVNKDLKVYSHEGQHRALSAIEAGIEHIPVYVYGDGFNDEQLEEISDRPMRILKPDDRY